MFHRNHIQFYCESLLFITALKLKTHWPSKLKAHSSGLVCVLQYTDKTSELSNSVYKNVKPEIKYFLIAVPHNSRK